MPAPIQALAEEEEEEEESEYEYEEESEEEAEEAIESKWLGQPNVEVQDCDPDDCPLVCSACEWKPCKVTEDDGTFCTICLDEDDRVCNDILYRFLRKASTSKRKRA